MRSILRVASLLLLAVSGLVCAAFAGGPIPFVDAVAKAETPVAGKEYYARHSFMYEEGKHITTNYWRGTLVPINSRIKVEAATASKLLLRVVETGETIDVDNIAKFTKCDLRGIARRMLSVRPVDLGDCDKATVDAIKSGTMLRGMTKDQVLMARGFPPAHKTPVLSSDRWQYWSSRFVVQTIVFADGKLLDGRGVN